MPNPTCSQAACLCNSCKKRVWTPEGMCDCWYAPGDEDKPPCDSIPVEKPGDCGDGYEPTDGVSGSRCVDCFLTDAEWEWLQAERPALAEKLRGVS